MPVGDSSDEMDVSPKESNDSGDYVQGNPAALGSQGVPSAGQDASENQESSAGMSAGTSSRPLVPSSATEMPPAAEGVVGQCPIDARARGMGIADQEFGTSEPLSGSLRKRERRSNDSSESEDPKQRKMASGDSPSSEESVSDVPQDNSNEGSVSDQPSNERSVTERRSNVENLNEGSATEQRSNEGSVSSDQHSTDNSNEGSVRDGSSNDENSNEELVGGQPAVAHRLNTLNGRMSKYAVNAQGLLLTVLEEVMALSNERGMYLEFERLFQSFRESPSDANEILLDHVIKSYLSQRVTALKIKYMRRTEEQGMEYEVMFKYNRLLVIVITALWSTVLARKKKGFKEIKESYGVLQRFYDGYLEFWRDNDISDEENEYSRNAERFKTITEKLLFQTRNAFRELLIHVGEYAAPDFVSNFERRLRDEDLRCLRRQFNPEDFREGVDREDSNEGVDREVDA